MGARLVTTFCDEAGEAVAHIYDHWAADREQEAETCLQAFFDAVQGQCPDTRFTDPSYLAAKFVVWRAGGYALSETYKNGATRPENVKPLDFLSLGIVPNEESHGPEHIVRVHPPKGGDSRPRLEHILPEYKRKLQRERAVKEQAAHPRLARAYGVATAHRDLAAELGL